MKIFILFLFIILVFLLYIKYFLPCVTVIAHNKYVLCLYKYIFIICIYPNNMLLRRYYVSDIHINSPPVVKSKDLIFINFILYIKYIIKLSKVNVCFCRNPQYRIEFTFCLKYIFQLFVILLRINISSHFNMVYSVCFYQNIKLATYFFLLQGCKRYIFVVKLYT